MDWLWGILGMALGGVLVYAFLHRPQPAEPLDTRALVEGRVATERARISQIYERRIIKLQAEHEEALVYVRKLSVNRSRAVLKGKMAEQMAPLLPGFTYWPADARFLGDPIDYVVFDGYSACKDNHTEGSDMEVVILDIKQGKSRLTREQRRIAEAVAAGRVRFEVVRVSADGTIRSTRWGYEAVPDGSGDPN